MKALGRQPKPSWLEADAGTAAPPLTPRDAPMWLPEGTAPVKSALAHFLVPFGLFSTDSH